ncbi:hypothetical protein [Paraflavitalea speifideaquila]|uniref:hypothetical protein n=1 Tax=Paraflavitalea speifideaquila TaxID=3076558 RepID=UPI0028E6F4DD|nr:hypothetical protein [Paraflavitalea speifideiaquila]
MDKKYWDEMSPKYEEEIFDVLKNDKHGVIKSRIQEFASPKKTVADIGCAVGKWLPLLSSSFEKVYALDHSEKYTAYAQAKFEKKTISILSPPI